MDTDQYQFFKNAQYRNTRNEKKTLVVAILDNTDQLILGSFISKVVGLKKAVIDGDIDNGSLMAGQSVSMVKKIQPVKEIIEEIIQQASHEYNE